MARFGTALTLLAWVALAVALMGRYHAFIYWMVVLAHGLNIVGYIAACAADHFAKREFLKSRLLLVTLAEIIFAIAGPVALGAAEATRYAG